MICCTDIQIGCEIDTTYLRRHTTKPLNLSLGAINAGSVLGRISNQFSQVHALDFTEQWTLYDFYLDF